MTPCIWCGDPTYPGVDEQCPYCGHYFHAIHHPKKNPHGKSAVPPVIGPSIESCYKLLISDAPKEKPGVKPTPRVVEYRLH